MDKKIGQLFFIGIKGKSLTAEESEFIIRHNIGGVILFSRNIESPEQVHELCSDLQALRHKMPDKAPLFIGIDMEGGRVARLKEPFTIWPPVKCIGDIGSTSVAFSFSLAMGAELKSVGLNVDFAPCIDVLVNPTNKAIGDRSLGSDPEAVSRLGSAIVRGYIKSGILPCAKHFPGHGNTILDSHDELPLDERSFDELMNCEGAAFKKVFRARLDLLMTTHVKFPKVDPEWPATLSEKWLKDILRDQMRFRGLIITDDLDMGALAKNFSVEEIPVQALRAGVNILLYCNEPTSPPRALQSIEKALRDKALNLAHIEDSYQKILDLKRKKFLNPDPPPVVDAARIVGNPDHKRLAEAIRKGQVPADLINKTADNEN